MGSEDPQDAYFAPRVIPAQPPGADHPPSTLHKVLRRQLLRHSGNLALAPTVAVFGLEGDQFVLLRIGMDRSEDAILGLILPHQFTAIGVIAASVVATPPGRHHLDAALALGVDRQGAAISLLADVHGSITETSNPSGWLVDACQRSLGLATEPSTIVPLAFPIALWLDRVMVAVLNGGPQPLTWNETVSLCPVPDRWRSSDPVDLGTTLASTTPSWAALRASTMRGERTPLGVGPHLARWMDDPMFARWCMGSFPDLEGLRSDIEFLAPDEVALGLSTALRAAWSSLR